MLDLGFWEILIIVVIAILVLKPEDIPEVLRAGGKYLGKVKDMGRELSNAITDIGKETGVGDIKHEMTKIIDLEGKERLAYDVSAIEELEAEDAMAEIDDVENNKSDKDA